MNGPHELGGRAGPGDPDPGTRARGPGPGDPTPQTHTGAPHRASHRAYREYIYIGNNIRQNPQIGENRDYIPAIYGYI